MRVVLLLLLAINLLLFAYLAGQGPVREAEQRPLLPQERGDLRLLDEVPDEFRRRPE